MDDIRKSRLAAFTDWVAKNIRGDEKSEAHIFLDRLFQAFGQPGCLDVGGQPEFRIRKDQEDGGGTAFADYVWKPVVLIEMKRRGVDLARHYRQAFDYWTRLVPGRPQYVVLCNFDEFCIYDFNAQMDSPVDRVTLTDLPDRPGPLAFLFRVPQTPVFGNDHVAVTRKAADHLALCFNKLITRRVDRRDAQRFILQMLVALFAEDIGLLDQYLVVRLLEDCNQPTDSFDLLGGLFAAMNTPGRVAGGRFKGVDYFNGGLFAEPARLELYPDEINQLKSAAAADWSKVRPEIFGTLFEHSLGHEERHAFGAHFTSPVDIMKIVGPTIVAPWRERIENARTIAELNWLLERMHSLTVLDTACGSGNFLYIAYRELKRLEGRIFERIAELSSRVDPAQGRFGFVTARQFFGMDINPFAVELAKVTMMIARKLAIDELHVNEHALPLDNLDGNFIAGDALIDSAGQPTVWPRADVIIGNPPFLGAKRLKPERGADYVNAIRKLYPDVPGMADYCVYWFRRAHDHLPVCTPADPFAGRAGLVGTQNIRNNQSRVGGLDYIVRSGTIVEAVDSQPWSGEANVHVSIVNWVKTASPSPSKGEGRGEGRGEGLADQSGRTLTRPGNAGATSPLKGEVEILPPSPCNQGEGRGEGSSRGEAALGVRRVPPLSPPAAGRQESGGIRRTPKARFAGESQPEGIEAVPQDLDPADLLIPASKKLWSKVQTSPGVKAPRRRGAGPASKEYELAFRESPEINSALSDQQDVSGAAILRCNQEPPNVFNGQFPRHQGFVLSPAEAKRFLHRDAGSREVIHPFLIGAEMLTKAGPQRWVIDFQKMDVLHARRYPGPFKWIEERILPHVTAYAERERAGTGQDAGQDQTWLRTWWQHFRCRKEMVDRIAQLRRYLVCAEVTKRPIFCFVDPDIRPDHTLEAFMFPDDYSFGILQSNAHCQWFITKCSKLTERFRYTPESVFDTFPWPQGPSAAQVRAVAAAGREIRRIRDEALAKIKGGLRALYRTLELPGANPLKDAHAALDRAVLDAYGFTPKQDILAALLDLNQAVAARIDAGQPVTPPGVPSDFPDSASLVSNDCIRPE